MKIKTFTGIGARHRQEDAYAVVEMPEQKRILAIVADGMGGHGYGDEASKIVVDAISDYWIGNPQRHDCEKKIIDAVAQAGVMYEKNAKTREMGSTLAMLAIDGNTGYMAHCGDSRIYYWNKNNHHRFYTNDHTKISEDGWELVSNAFFTGMCGKIVPEIRKIEFENGDRVMICTDGVFRFIEPAQLWLTLTSEQTIDCVADDLESQCMAMAGDNFTAILIEF